MRALWEIFRLEWRSSVRSRAFALLMLASVAWMLAAPSLLKSDGTADGAFELTVRYSLGAVFVVVLVSLAASAAGSLARERAARRLQLTLVRPVRHFTVALGRMAALASMGSLVLAVSAAILGARIGAGRVCYHVHAPELEPAEAVVERAFAKYMADSAAFREGVARDGERPYKNYMLGHLEQIEDYQRIAPGASTNWVFAADAAGPGDGCVAEFRFTGILGLRQDVAGDVRFRGREGRLDDCSQRHVRVALERTEGAADPGGPAVLEFVNTGKEPVMMNPRHDVRLLVAGGSFAGNLFRAWAELSCVLSLVVALAVALGACLGRSVAVFTVVSVLFVGAVSPSLVDDYPDPTAQDGIDRIAIRFTEAAAAALSPVSELRPVDRLVDDACIEWPEVGRAAAADVILLPLAFAWIAGLVMRRKHED